MTILEKSAILSAVCAFIGMAAVFAGFIVGLVRRYRRRRPMAKFVNKGEARNV